MEYSPDFITFSLGFGNSEVELLRLLGRTEEEIERKVGNTITVSKIKNTETTWKSKVVAKRESNRRKYEKISANVEDTFDQECYRFSRIRLAYFTTVCDNVYVLRLCSHKWYVGFTTNIEKRMHDHFSRERGSKMTKLYRPLEVMMIIKGDLDDEDQVTLEMMKLFGVKHVRGGRWHQPNFSKKRKEKIKEIVEETNIKYTNAEEEIMNFVKFFRKQHKKMAKT
jgi:predicted GIY-YIG superfamily endonuclease